MKVMVRGTPFQCVERCQNDNNDDNGEEPFAVHHTLPLVPIAVHDIAVEEEGEIEEHLNKAGILQEIEQIGLSTLIALRP